MYDGLYPVPQLASIPVSWDSEWSLAVLEPGWVRQWRADQVILLLYLSLLQSTDDLIMGVVILDFPV